MIKKILFAAIVFLSISAKSQVYYENIAGILDARCITCHNQYGHVDLRGYSNAKTHAPTISAYLQSGYMPPWPPDTTYTRFVHERLISNAEKNAVINWVNGGTLYQDTTLAPPVPAYTKYQLSGTPSLVLTIPTFTSGASSADKYYCFSLPMGTTQDEVLRAFEIVPGDPSIVHHVVVNVDTTGTVASDMSGSCFTEPGQFSIGGYAPGGEPLVFPSGQALKLGMRLKAGSNIILQIHYPKGTAGKVDSTCIRMYFYPQGTTGIRTLTAKTILQNWSMFIAANSTATFTAQYPSSSSSTLSGPLSLYATFPHSHNICTHITNWADSTGGTNTIPLVRINNWDFNWQGYYTYHNMVKVPKGYKIRSSHFFDNTTNNPTNPNPQNVTAGTSTSNEMLFDAYMYTNYLPGDENISIDTLLKGDTLLMNSVHSYAQPQSMRVGVYPNPFSDKVSIVYDLAKTSVVSISVFNVFGQEVAKMPAAMEMKGIQEHEWDGRNENGVSCAPGMYTYRLMIDGTVYSGKIILKAKN